MGLRNLKPVTPGQRGKIISTFEEITTSKPEKSLLVPLKKSGGRNNSGKMTIRYKGGGHKRMYRIIDFRRDKDGIPAKVMSVEYDPNRSSRIALVVYKDGEKRYILAPNGLNVGNEIISGTNIPPEIGNALFIYEIPLGTIIHNVELRPGQGAAIASSAGSYAQLTSREGKYAIIRFPSGEARKIPVKCKATIGAVSNSDHQLERFGKA